MIADAANYLSIVGEIKSVASAVVDSPRDLDRAHNHHPDKDNLVGDVQRKFLCGGDPAVNAFAAEILLLVRHGVVIQMYEKRGTEETFLCPMDHQFTASFSARGFDIPSSRSDCRVMNAWKFFALVSLS